MFSSFKNAKFVSIFNSGMRHYIDGNWEKARAELENAEKSKGIPDYPSRSLLKYMSEHGYVAPKDWKGHRALTEK